MVAGDGVEPPTEAYEATVIPFYQPATFVYYLNLPRFLYIEKPHLQP